MIIFQQSYLNKYFETEKKKVQLLVGYKVEPDWVPTNKKIEKVQFKVAKFEYKL